MSWLLNKYTLRLLLAAAVAGGVWWGYHTIHKAFTDRTQLQKQVDDDKDAIKAAEQARDDARRDARKKAQDLQDEIRLRETIAHLAKVREQQTRKELSHARDTLQHWKDTASPELARCLNVVVPAEPGSVHQRPTPAATGAEDGHGLHHPAGPVHGNRPGAAAGRSTDIHAAPGPRDVPRLGPDAERQAQRYADVGQ